MASLAVPLANEVPPPGAAVATRPALRLVDRARSRPSTTPNYADAGPNWGAIAVIAAAHAALIALLLTTGAVRLDAAPPPVAVNFVEEIAEPTVEAPLPEAPMETVATDLFVPDVIIETPVAAPPPPLAVTQTPPPAKATVAPTVAKGSGDSPIVPPDFSADQLNNAGPRYPSASRRSREEGTVLLKVLVSPDGRAQDLAVATSSGFARLDDAALDTVRRWAFLPAKQAGKAVAAWVLVPVTFELGDAPRGRGGRFDRRRARDRGEPQVPELAEPSPT